MTGLNLLIEDLKQSVRVKDPPWEHLKKSSPEDTEQTKLPF